MGQLNMKHCGIIEFIQFNEMHDWIQLHSPAVTIEIALAHSVNCCKEVLACRINEFMVVAVILIYSAIMMCQALTVIFPG